MPTDPEEKGREEKVGGKTCLSSPRREMEREWVTKEKKSELRPSALEAGVVTGYLSFKIQIPFLFLTSPFPLFVRSFASFLSLLRESPEGHLFPSFHFISLLVLLS